MPETPRQMHLAFLLTAGVHVGGWRLPEAEFDPDSFELQVRLVQTAEKAKFDMVFLADSLFTSRATPPSQLSRLEPLTLLSALAVCTSRIGLAATAATTYGQPYHLARMFASLDHISNGRAGWNIVTGSNASSSLNFNMEEPPDKEIRYEIAAEFVEVCKGLWDSWEDDAFVKDKAAGIPADFSKMHTLNHKGRHFQVQGPLNVARSPQGYPAIIQAGASATGLEFAARYAEVIFTVQEDLETTKAFGAKVRGMAEKLGRDPASIKIIPGICPYSAESEDRAREMLSRMASYADPVAAMQMLSQRLGLPDVEDMPLDAPVPEIPREQMRGHAITLTAVARKYGLNIGQLRDYASASMGHRMVFGSPEQIADDLEEWFASGAADGFILHPAYVPGPMEHFTETVVPILQKRGVFRTEYTGTTLRDHLGLERPPHPATLARAAG